MSELDKVKAEAAKVEATTNAAWTAVAASLKPALIGVGVGAVVCLLLKACL